MADTIDFELVSPDRLVKSQPVEMVVVPGAEGDLGVLPGHSPLIAEVRPGVIDIHEGGKVGERIFIAGGFCENQTFSDLLLSGTTRSKIFCANLRHIDAPTICQAVKIVGNCCHLGLIPSANSPVQ